MASKKIHLHVAPVAEYESIGNGRIGTTNSATLKRHPKMELNKNDMLRLLSYLEGELQAREIVIATLKAEKAKQLLCQARYGRFGLNDPYFAIQRDANGAPDDGFDDTAVKAMYENQLGQLEHLIAVQRQAQAKLKDQMKNGEVKYNKINSELNDEKRKHAMDMAQGDDVTYALGKDRERLKDEIDFERSQNKKLEKEVKKLQASLDQEQTNANKHKQVAIMLIKERRQLAEKLNLERRRSRMLEVHLLEERQKVKKMAEGLMEESRKSLLMEATMEKQLSEFDTQNEQMKQKLSKEEVQIRETSLELEACRQQLVMYQKQMSDPSRDSPQSIEIKSSAKVPQESVQSSDTNDVSATNSDSRVNAVASPVENNAETTSVTTNTNTNTNTTTTTTTTTVIAADTSNSTNTNKSAAPHVQKVDNNTSYRVTLKSADSASGATTFTMPPGCKVSLSVGGQATSPSQVGHGSYQRRAGRGVAPPVPPNKPTLLPGGMVKRATEAFERPTSP